MPLSPEQALVNGSKGGRPRGETTPEGRLKLKVEKAINRRVYRMAAKLVDSQAIAAIGTHKVVVITKDSMGLPQVETIRDIKRIEELIDTGEYGKDYLIVAGAEPDWKAANALLDRGFGKAKESMKLDVEVQFSLKNLADRRKVLKPGQVELLPVETEEQDEEIN